MTFLSRSGLWPLCLLATLTLGCPEPGGAPAGRGGDPPPPADMGPMGMEAGMEMEMGAPPDAGGPNYEEGPGPLSPRVENETCRLPAARRHQDVLVCPWDGIRCRNHGKCR